MSATELLETFDTIGTVYLAPNGDVYRLKWITQNRRTRELRPDYAIISAAGLHGDSHSLPGGSITIHEPELALHDFVQVDDADRCKCGSPVEAPQHAGEV